MTAAEKLERAMAYKFEGNEWFKANNIVNAADAYYRAVLFCRDLTQNPKYYRAVLFCRDLTQNP